MMYQVIRKREGGDKMIKKRYIAGMLLIILGLVTTISVTVAPSLTAKEGYGKLRKQIPFVGMVLSYQIYCHTCSPPMFSRIVTFYGDPSETYVWERDSANTDDPDDDLVFQIDKETRNILGEETYSRPLFPTNLHIGDEVTIFSVRTVTIVGSKRMSVMGKNVNTWIAHTAGYRMYYEKETGIWLGGTVGWWEDDTLCSYTIHLVSTNVPL